MGQISHINQRCNGLNQHIVTAFVTLTSDIFFSKHFRQNVSMRLTRYNIHRESRFLRHSQFHFCPNMTSLQRSTAYPYGHIRRTCRRYIGLMDPRARGRGRKRTVRTSGAEEGTLQCTRRGHSAWTLPVRDEKVTLGLGTSQIVNEERNENRRRAIVERLLLHHRSHTRTAETTRRRRRVNFPAVGHAAIHLSWPATVESERLHPPRAHQALAANTSRREPPLLTMAGWASEGRGAGPCRSEASAWTLLTYHSTRHHRYKGSAPNNTK